VPTSSQSSIRSFVQEHRPTHRNRGFSCAARQRVLSYVRERRQAGATWDGIAEEVGVSRTTLRSWSRASEPAVASLVPVVVAETPSLPNSSLCLTSPSGYRLEGLCIEEAIVVLGALR